MQKKVTVYGNTTCPYCGAARMLLTKKAIDFDEINVSGSPEKLAEMKARSGGRTVPQIFIGDSPIGGFDQLDALENSGELDKLLAE